MVFFILSIKNIIYIKYINLIYNLIKLGHLIFVIHLPFSSVTIYRMSKVSTYFSSLFTKIRLERIKFFLIFKKFLI